MRATKWLAALGVALALGGAVSAQSFFGFGSSSTPAGKVVDTSKAIALPMPAPSATTRLRGFIPAFRGFSNQRTMPTSNFPTAAQMPGTDYLKAFKFGRGVSIVP
jgi:hypothetical protein